MSSKQTAVVTGASQGIGAALVEALVNAGYNVVATSRNVNQALAASSNLVLVAGDIGQEETAAKVVAAAIENFGRIDLLVTNAGIFSTKSFTEFTTDDFNAVVSTNLLGGCRGTTGPSSADPATGLPYGPDFPVITVADMVRTERAFLDVLGIERLAAVAGGSLGGMQAFEWAVLYPDQVDTVVAIASTHALHPQGVAWNARRLGLPCRVINPLSFIPRAA